VSKLTVYFVVSKYVYSHTLDQLVLLQCTFVSQLMPIVLSCLSVIAFFIAIYLCLLLMFCVLSSVACNIQCNKEFVKL